MPDKSREENLERAVSALFATSGLLDPIRLRIWDSEGLTVTQIRLLFHVAAQEGISNAELADRLRVTRPSVSALLERLERGGFIVREVDREDRRGIRVSLQPKARQALTALRPELRGFGRSLFENLSDDDIAMLTEALETLVSANVKRAPAPAE